MIADGLAQACLDGLAKAISQASLDLIRESGFAEYCHPETGEPVGGGRCIWTAAMLLEFLAQAE